MSVVTNERHAFVACVEIQVPVHAIDVPRGFGQTAHNVQCVRALLVKGDCPPLRKLICSIVDLGLNSRLTLQDSDIVLAWKDAWIYQNESCAGQIL